MPCRSQREHRLRHPSTSSEAALLRPRDGGGPRASLQRPHAAHHSINSFALAGAHGTGCGHGAHSAHTECSRRQTCRYTSTDSDGSSRTLYRHAGAQLQSAPSIPRPRNIVKRQSELRACVCAREVESSAVRALGAGRRVRNARMAQIPLGAVDHASQTRTLAHRPATAGRPAALTDPRAQGAPR